MLLIFLEKICDCKKFKERGSKYGMRLCFKILNRFLKINKLEEILPLSAGKWTLALTSGIFERYNREKGED